MIQEFKTLTREESTILFDSIPLITILIAGASGNINRNDKNWELRIAKIRTFSNPDNLHDYYHMVGKNYVDRMNSLIDEFPIDSTLRSKIIFDKLQKLNNVLSKLELNFASSLYQSFISFAKHVGKSSGGFLGIGRINRAERKWINLPMLNPISPPDKGSNLKLTFA